MSRTITLRLKDENYELFTKFAELDNRTLSNFIETAVLRYIEEKMLHENIPAEEKNPEEKQDKISKKTHKKRKK